MYRRVTTIVIALALTSASCGGDGASVDVSSQPADPLPIPSELVVLTARGDLTNPNVGVEVQADIAGLESLGLVTVTLFEPFVSESVEFSGVPLNDVLAAIGVEDAAPLTWTALDDYQVHFTLGEVAPENALLATRQEGEPIAIEDGGPIRIVFADDSGPIGGDSNEWIWSLSVLDVG